MYTATYKNRQVKVQREVDLKPYKEKGYTIKDEKGNLVYKPADPAKDAEKLKAENEALKAEIAELKAAQETAAKTTAKKKTTGSEE